MSNFNQPNNRLIYEYSNNNLQKNNNPYNKNNMLSNNPRFSSFIQENSFQDRINIAKMEKLKKAQNIRDLGMTNEELTNIVINPLKIEKIDKKEKEELLNNYHNKECVYDALGKYSVDKKNDKSNAIVPKEIADLWKNSKNTPYKQILHFLEFKEYTDKNYKKNSDLIIHKTTQLDKLADVRILKKELKKLQNLLFNHDNELKTIYSDNRKKKFLEKFEYENKCKNKIKYDPKNCSELKELYKKEQKRINKQNKRIDDMIEMLMASEDLSKDELEEIKKIQEMDDKQMQKYEQSLEFVDKDEKIHQRDLEKELEKEIQKEMGKEEYKKLMKHLEQNSDNDNDNDSDSDNDNKNKSIKIKKSKESQNESPKEPQKESPNEIKNKYVNREKENEVKTPTQPIQPVKKIITIKKTNKNEANEEKNNANENEGTIAKLDKYKNR
jgi:hypothetical protein